MITHLKQNEMKDTLKYEEFGSIAVQIPQPLSWVSVFLVTAMSYIRN